MIEINEAVFFLFLFFVLGAYVAFVVVVYFMVKGEREHCRELKASLYMPKASEEVVE